MNQEEFKRIELGNIVKYKGRSESCVVVGGNSIDGFMLARTTLMTNPYEWEIVHLPYAKCTNCAHEIDRTKYEQAATSSHCYKCLGVLISDFELMN